MLQAYRWTRQPQQSTPIDWSNQLARGLVFWFDPISMSDLATGISAAGITKPTGYSRGPALRHDGFGLVATGAQTADYEFVTRDPLSGLANFTIAWFGTLSALQTNGVLVGKLDTTNQTCQTLLIANGSSNFVFYVFNTTATPFIRSAPAGFSPVIGQRTCVMGSAALSGSATLYVNGIDATGGITSGSLPATAPACSKGWSIANNYLHTIPAASATLIAAAWSRSLSAAEARAFNENPWQVLQPRIARGARVFSPLTAAVGTFT